MSLSPREATLQRQLEALMKGWGRYESVRRFVRKLDKTSTKLNYLRWVGGYFEWLGEDHADEAGKVRKAVGLDPDQLLSDNLECIFASKPTDVLVKRRHTEWLDQYVNYYMRGRGVGSLQVGVAAAVRMFYKRNDSALFGDFRVSLPDPKDRDPALPADDVRAVLKALPLQVRLPLQMEWQGGVEVSRVLGLRWEKVLPALDGGQYPLKLSFQGRKKHRKAYHTYNGRDVVDGLKVWREEWARLWERAPGPADLVFPGKRGNGTDYSWLNEQIKTKAMQLARQGLVRTKAPGAWHSHPLRSSFETEAAHAGVPKEVRGFFEGHLSDVMWVYNHGDELHEEDLVREWLKVEPFVSLEPSEALVREAVERETGQQLRVAQAQIRRLQEEQARMADVLDLVAKGKVKVVPPPERPQPS